MELAQGSVTAWLPFNSAIYTAVPLRLRLPTAMMVHFFYSIGLALWEVGALGHRPAAADAASASALSHPPTDPAAADAASASALSHPPTDPDGACERRPERILDRRSVAAAAAAAAAVAAAPRERTTE